MKIKVTALLACQIAFSSLSFGSDFETTNDPKTIINQFTLPEKTSEWKESILQLTKTIFPEDGNLYMAFDKLATYTCAPEMDLQNTNPQRRAETIRYSFLKLLDMESNSRVSYIEEQLNRHKKYLQKN
jgi:hypothetical protein